MNNATIQTLPCIIINSRDVRLMTYWSVLACVMALTFQEGLQEVQHVCGDCLLIVDTVSRVLRDKDSRP